MFLFLVTLHHLSSPCGLGKHLQIKPLARLVADTIFHLSTETFYTVSNRDTDELRGDSALLARLRDGDEAAFDLLVEAYIRPLIRHAAQIVGSVEAGREIVQEVFLRLWRIRDNISPDWDIAAYLYGSTRQRAINFARSDLTTREREYLWLKDLQLDDPGLHADPEADRPLHEEPSKARAIVWAAAQNLAPRCREVFLLVWDRRLSYSEVSRLLGVAEPTVRRHMSRAIQQLAATLGPKSPG